MKNLIVLALLVSGVALTACNRTRNEMPAERAGRAVDNAIDKTHDALAETGSDIKGTAQDARARARQDNYRDDSDRTSSRNR